MTRRVLWMQPGGGDSDIEYAAVDDRALIQGLFHDEGVKDTLAGHLKVTQRAEGPNFSVDVAPGVGFVFGDDVSGQGMYMIGSDATENVEVPAPPGSGSRTHRVVAQVMDKLHNSGDWATYEWEPVLLEDEGSGTPDVPDSAISLATVAVSAGQVSVTNEHITDTRLQACLITSKFALASSANQPPAPYTSEVTWWTDVGCYKVYDGSQQREIPHRDGGGSAWTTYTPVLTALDTNPTLGSGAVRQGRYIRYGRMVHVEASIIFGSGSNRGAGIYEVSLPVAARQQASGRRTGSAYGWDNSLGDWADGVCFINSGATDRVRLSIDSTVMRAESPPFPWVWGTGDELGFSITYEAAS